MSLEKFIKKLKKFLKNKDAELIRIKTNLYENMNYTEIQVSYYYKGVILISNALNPYLGKSLKDMSDFIFDDIEKNLKNIENFKK